VYTVAARGETCRRPPTPPSQKLLSVVAMIFRLSGVDVRTKYWAFEGKT
jgi:hypothetical protein